MNHPGGVDWSPAAAQCREEHVPSQRCWLSFSFADIAPPAHPYSPHPAVGLFRALPTHILSLSGSQDAGHHKGKPFVLVPCPT